MIRRAFQLVQILSIDIVIGVVVLLRFFCAQYGISLRWEVYALLGATVWLIYCVDHLKDASKALNSKRDRYVFHKRHKRSLVFFCLIVFAGIIPLLFSIPESIFRGGLVLAFFSLIYLLIQHKLSTLFSKELYVAIVYSLGVLMVPMLEENSFSFTHLLLLTLLAYSNLLMFSWFERVEDRRDGFDSIATKIGAGKLESLILTLVAVGLSLSILDFNPIHVYFLTAFGIYTLVMLFKERLGISKAYRTIGDAVFLLPILFEWM